MGPISSQEPPEPVTCSPAVSFTITEKKEKNARKMTPAVVTVFSGLMMSLLSLRLVVMEMIEIVTHVQ